MRRPASALVLACLALWSLVGSVDYEKGSVDTCRCRYTPAR